MACNTVKECDDKIKFLEEMINRHPGSEYIFNACAKRIDYYTEKRELIRQYGIIEV